ncbi:MAG TPA: hypothetical protein VGN63_22370 [Flavisolibacter sp.]|jgi:hypothetical protein|nr:hypothetical protein [Flavisolibacter sp.]
MELKMKLDGKLIAAVTVDKANCKNEKYLHSLKDNLRQKYQGLITKLQKQPVFYLYIASDERA